ncbi:MAG: dCTP deaminase [Candidatus Eisenbacteria bacterium]|nr:dCTP deaminase [Candidatus Eisenbacteria bacterium]
MSVQPDRWIRRMALEARMIEPFEEGGARPGLVSFGLSSYGYDVRLAGEFKIFTGEGCDRMDPKQVREDAFVDHRGDALDLPPHSFVLGRTIEYFRIPRDILAIGFGKSTYARSGIVVNVTPFEPEWEGHATLGISNTTPRPARIYANEGIAQVIFLQAAEPCEVSYRDKGGRYQAQKTITPPRV